MKNIHLAVAFSAAMVLSWQLRAADSQTRPMEVQWKQLCGAADGHLLKITTSTGETVEGYCMSITVDEVSIRTEDHHVTKLAHAALSRITMRRAKGRQLRALGKVMKHGFKEG